MQPETKQDLISAIENTQVAIEHERLKQLNLSLASKYAPSSYRVYADQATGMLKAYVNDVGHIIIIIFIY